MLSVRACALVVVAALLAACGRATAPQQPVEPDLATIRAVAWTNTARELAGLPSGADDADATMSTFGEDPMVGAASIASGGLVLSLVHRKGAEIVVGQAARTGEIRWRHEIPTTRDRFVECQDDNGGPLFACKVTAWRDGKAYLLIMSDETGRVRTKLPVDHRASFGVTGDELYLATFEPVQVDSGEPETEEMSPAQRLEVTVTRTSWTTESKVWRQDAAFAIEGWGHDGGSGFIIGKDRVVAYSASWQVIVDRASGRLLERSDQGRWEDHLPSGARVMTDSGDGTGDRVDATLFSADGKPLAEVSDAGYPDPFQTGRDGVVIGRRLLALGTGKVRFAAPKGTKIIAVVDRGRIAVAQRDEYDFDYSTGRVPFSTHDTRTGKRIASFSIRGNWTGDAVSGGRGVVLLVGHYDDERNVDLAPTLEVIDARRPGVAASIELGKRSPDEFGQPTVVRTPAGVAVTTVSSVQGLVAR